MSGSPFYNVDEMEQIAVNLFYGWGYNFYRLENQLRADDLLFREHCCALLGQSRTMVEAAQSAWRRDRLPPPTRARPLPDPDALAAARALEALSGGIGEVEGLIRSLPVPENDRMTQRYRQEAETLSMLGSFDKRLIGMAETLRQMLDGKDAAWMLANMATLHAGVAMLLAQVRERQMLLK